MNKNVMVLGLALSLVAGAVSAAGKDKDVTYVVEVRSNIVGEKANVMSGVLGADRPSAELNRTREVSYVKQCDQDNTRTVLIPGSTWDGVRINARLNADGGVTVAVDKRELTALENFRNPDAE